ncbi:MAG: dienelactone hydrolase family protein [Bacteroidetes bacterium]|nr:dienelactone hydrolase family protein [Bacteroidota bacterium]
MKTQKREIILPIHANIELKGSLHIPEHSRSIVIFSHGSGSSRFSSTNLILADMLNEEGIATLQPDLLTDEEDCIYENRIDIELLATRLSEITKFIQALPEFSNFEFAYIGAGTGVASALISATKIPGLIKSVVSRGGRPDLAEDVLPKVQTPVLFIVGSFDEEVLDQNIFAFNILNCEKKMMTISHASHLFEEPGKLKEVAELATAWFKRNFKSVSKCPFHNFIISSEPSALAHPQRA